jgi:hypothetical protein
VSATVAPGARVLRFLGAGAGPLLVVAAVIGVQSIVSGWLAPVLAAPLTAGVAIAVYCLHTRYLERRAPVEFAAQRLPWLASGTLLGIALIAAVMFSLGAAGVYHVEGPAPFPVDLAAAAAAALATAVVEEVLFRGYLFRWIAYSNVWGAVLATSLLFGFAHAFNPHATVFSSAAIAVEAGLLLSAAYWLGGNLWFPIGIHLGWNFTEGTIFSTPVSGAQTPGLIVGTLRGPQALTGGSFGIEASVVALLLCTAAGAVMLALCVARKASPVR